MMRMLRDVWMNGTPKLPLSAHMMSTFRSVFQRACAPRLLGNLIAGTLPERMCAECGKSFTHVSPDEHRIYQEHMKKHALEAPLDCGCDNVTKIRTHKAKERHMRLHHSGGKFEQCPQCVKVVEKGGVEDHIAKFHAVEEACCEFCGKSYPNR